MQCFLCSGHCVLSCHVALAHVTDVVFSVQRSLCFVLSRLPVHVTDVVFLCSGRCVLTCHFYGALVTDVVFSV